METILKPYPDYAPTELPWAGALPSHWRTERAKWLFTKMERPVRPEDETVTCFRDGVVTLRKNRRTTGFTESLKEIGYQGIRKGDLVIHAMDAFAGAVGVSDSDGKATPVYAACQPAEDVDAEYYARVVREMAHSQYVAALSTGIRQRSTDFRYSTFTAEFVPVPPTDEQRAISRYIVAAERKVNQLIRAKQRLIALLTKQKQAIIQRAVTQGLDPDARLKPSGIDLLEDMPEHWDLVPLRRLVTTVTSGSRGWAQFYSDEGDLFIQSGNLGRSMSLDMSKVQRVKLPESTEGKRTLVKRDDILVCITGALTGNAIVVDRDLVNAYINQHVALVRPRAGGVAPRFLGYTLHAPIGQGQFQITQYGGTKQGLGLDDVKSVLIPLPPRTEQDRIVRFLDSELSEADTTIDVVLREIALIREYRQRLVADVVTGKLDVRGVAVPEVDPGGLGAGAEGTAGLALDAEEIQPEAA